MFSAEEISRFNALNPTLFAFFTEAMNEVPMVRDQIFSVRNSAQASEHFEGVGDMPIEAFLQYKQGGGIGQSHVGSGHATGFFHEEYPLDVVYKYSDIRDMNSMKMQIETEAVAAGYRQFLETMAASVFNNGFSTSHQGADGQPLFSNSHRFSPDDTTNTWDNRGTSALSPTSLKATRLAMRTWQSHTGKAMGVRPNAILVHPAKYDEAEEYVLSTMKPTLAANRTDSNQLNVLRGDFQIIEWEYLNDMDNWIMLDLNAAMRQLFWFNREEMLMRPKPQESNQVEVKYGMLASFSFGWISPRFAYGHIV